MTNETHTPGPWGVGWRHGISAAAVVSNYSAEHINGSLVATCYGRAPGDAMLIAAAPDLLAALKDCLSWHDYADDLAKPIEVRAAYMRARAAIKKAESK